MDEHLQDKIKTVTDLVIRRYSLKPYEIVISQRNSYEYLMDVIIICNSEILNNNQIMIEEIVSNIQALIADDGKGPISLISRIFGRST